jgi:hydrogenase assembly chaperone HypC/HupF
MCLGIPMQVIEIDPEGGGAFAWCSGQRQGMLVRERINVLWVDGVSPGDWVYVVLGQAKEKLTPQRAEEIRLALAGVAAALAGKGDLDAYFPGLVGRGSDRGA